MNAQYNMLKCPDCGKIFNSPRKLGDICGNWNGYYNCVSYVDVNKKGRLYWWNENWG